MPKVSLSVPHQLQQSDADCLAACAAMVLAYLGREIDYALLLELLGIRPFGAPAGNIRLLADLGLEVVYSKTDTTGLPRRRLRYPVVILSWLGWNETTPTR